MPAPGCIFPAAQEQIQFPQFEKDASIILVGNRGTGTSTLSLILSIALQWQVLDVSDTFRKQHGATRVAYQEEHGSGDYRKQHSRVLHSILETNTERSVIVCDPLCLDGDGPRLLRAFGSRHLVLHVTRDRKWTQHYLKAERDETFHAFSRYVDNLIRTCSNREYHNLSQDFEEGLLAQQGQPNAQKQGTPSLRLKQVAHDFLLFVRKAVGRPIPGFRPDSQRLELAPELRPYSYCLEIPLGFRHSRLDITSLKPGADVIELIIDMPVTAQDRRSLELHAAESIGQNVAFLRRYRETPIILHVNMASIESNKMTEESLQLYMYLIHCGLRTACEYVTVDLRMPDHVFSHFISLKSDTKIIGHFFDHEAGPSSWSSDERFRLYERARSLGCDLTRLLQEARSKEDNSLVQDFLSRIEHISAPRPLAIAYNLGAQGRTSQVFNKIFSPIASQNDDQILTTLTMQQAQQALFASFVLDPLKFYVIGMDVSYSPMPAMFNTAFQAYGMLHTWEVLQASSLAEVKEVIGEDNFGGATFPPPFKTDILPVVGKASPSARVIGAVNTLMPLRRVVDPTLAGGYEVRHKASFAGPVELLYGENTDWIGLKACIHRSLSPANAIEPKSTGLVIGAGGMARGAIFAMVELGIRNILVLNRTLSKAQKLITDMNLAFAEHYQREALSEETRIVQAELHLLDPREDTWPLDYSAPTVIVSCIPEIAELTIPDEWMGNRTGGVFVQAGYKILNSPLIRRFQKKASQGWVTQDGLDVLPAQAFAQFELFTGRPAPRCLMREAALRSYCQNGEHLHEDDIQRRLRWQTSQHYDHSTNA